MPTIDWSELRIWAHIGAGSLTAALAIAAILVRGKYFYVSRTALASGAFWMASIWFWGLGATVKDHSIIGRTELMQPLAIAEISFVALGWTWFIAACIDTFTIRRRTPPAVVAAQLPEDERNAIDLDALRHELVWVEG